MSRNRWYLLLISSWLGLAAIITVAAVGIGASPSWATAALMAALACVPPVILVAVFRGAPDRSIAGVLYDTEHPSAGKNAGRR